MKNLVFIDPLVKNYQNLNFDLNDGTLWYVLDAYTDGVEQIQLALQGYSELGSIQIISHGAQGTLFLGSAALTNEALMGYQTALAGIGSSLSSSGDLLLYGCDVGKGDEGTQFIETLAELTGADVAASTDVSGPVALGGDSALEVQTGSIETTPLSLESLGFTLANSAPVLVAAAPTLAAITEDETNHVGQTVASILGSSLSDADAGASQGIALSNASSVNGKWQYRINSSASWVDVGSVSLTNALLLRSTDWLRWQPDGENGTTASLTYYGWDQSFAVAGNKLNISTRGGATPYSLNSDTATLVVSDLPDAPLFASATTSTLAENTTAAYTATATDPDAGTALSYTLGGTDAALFDINSSTGAVSFKVSPNFEAPADSGANNVYDITVTASDGALSASQTVAITVSNVNEAPVITSGGTATVQENATGMMYAVTATDVDAGTTLSYSLGGADAGLLNINSSSGELSFKVSPNFEAPADSGANNVYNITVTASDGALSASQALAITVTNVNEAPTGTARMLSAESVASTRALRASDITNTATQKFNTANSHIYEYVNANVTWTAAKTAAEAKTLAGLTGYLVTITSASEQSFVLANNVSSVGRWMGASDAAAEGNWKWVTGPEAGLQFWSGSHGGSVVNGAYKNWESGEPNNSADDDYAHFWTSSGLWNDAPNTGIVIGSNPRGWVGGYVIEYSGTVNTTSSIQVPSSTESHFTEDRTLYADGSLLGDPDGLGMLSFQWQRPTDSNANGAIDSSEWGNIHSATATAYTLGDADSGNYVRLAISYTDALGTQETVYSASSLAIKNINDAPVLVPAAPKLSSIAEDDTTNAGQTVSSLLGSTLSDVDANALQGIAIYGVSGSYGQWQYSANAGTSWVAVGSVSSSSALLLGSTELVRFLPDGSNGTTAKLEYYGWDQTSGSVGAKVSVASRGTTTAFSSAGDTAQLAVSSVDDAPRLAKPIPNQSVNEDTAFNYALPADVFNEVDGADTLGYFASLANNDPLPDWLGFDVSTRTFTGTPGNGVVGIYDIKVTSYDNTFLTATDTFLITVNNVNDAPVLTPAAPSLSPITEDDTTSAGQTVSSLLGSTLSDVDANALQGIAIYGVGGSYGQWQYSTNAGTSWVAVGTVAPSSALLLGSTELVRFLPDGSNGTTAKLEYYGWDQTSGGVGAKVNVASRGGTTAFSSTGDTAQLIVSSVDDAPQLANPIPNQSVNEDAAFNYAFFEGTFNEVDAADTLGYFASLANNEPLPDWLGFDVATRRFTGTPGNGVVGVYDIKVTAYDNTFQTATDTFLITVNNVNDAPVLAPAAPTLSSITEDNTSNTGQPVSSLLGTTTSDVDANALQGIAIYGVGGSYGQWQYSTNAGTSWVAVGAVSSSSALLIRSTDLVRFLPDGSNGTTAKLEYYGWDQTSGSVGAKVNVASRGGTTAFSIAGDTAQLVVSSLADAPTLTSATTSTLAENTTAAYTATATDPDAGTALIYTLGGTDAALFDINSSTGAVSFKVSPNFEAPADSGANNVYDITVTASDGALSASQTVAITVSNVNEAPVITSGGTATVQENATGMVYAVTATDVDAGTTLSYSLGGADAGLFNINSSSGELSFKAAPNFEAPADSGANNVYDITVTASDGALSASQAVAIKVANVNEAPTGTARMLSTESVASTRALLASDITNTATQKFNTANSHIYEYVDANVTWTAAKTAAEAKTLAGLTGYLVTITSASEQSFVLANNVSSVGRWMGASDAATEGTWRWVTGPEAGLQFWSGSSGGSVVNNAYKNWVSTEPNNSADEDYAHFWPSSGRWNDAPNTGIVIGSNPSGWVGGYVVEYSGTVSTTSSSQVPSGTESHFTEDKTLYADGSLLGDPDGLGMLSFQWQRATDSNANGAIDSSEWGNIQSATATSYTLGDADSGKFVRLAISYTDALGTQETVYSASSLAVKNINDVPSGSVTISGNATQGQTLTASNNLIDLDGIPSAGVSAVIYQWKAGGANIAGATSSTYTLSQAEVGKTITVVASYTDLQGTAESVTSAASAAVANVNDAPTGSITVAGTATQGQTLTASNTLADVDGIPTTGEGAIKYQWKAGGTAIGGAMASTYILTQAEVGKAITVTASYTDGGNTLESVTSEATALVTLAVVNAAPRFVLTTGKAIIPVGAGNDFGRAMMLQADGKILVAGRSDNPNVDYSLIRLNANGSLDTGFDEDGKAIIPVGAGNDFGRAMMLQADGKILVAGSSDNEGYFFSLIRLNANGSLDTSFDGDGKAIIPVGGWNDQGYAITLQADGKILVAGYSWNSSGENHLSVIRLNANGSLDTSFDGDGKAIIPVANVGPGYALTLQADGNILVAGSGWNGSNGDFSLIRLNASGSLDTSFNREGMVIIQVGTGHDHGQAMALQADGKILVAGTSGNGNDEDFSLIRLNANGSLDTSFDGDGKAIIPVGELSDYGQAITLQADGKILVAGRSWNGSDEDFSLIRLNANGSLDTSFDGDGKVIIPVGTGYDVGQAMALQADGKILVAGGSWNGSDEDFSLIRLNADGSLDTSFGATQGSNTLGGTVSYSENAPAIALDTSVAISDPELAALNNGEGNYSGASVSLARSTGANEHDVFGARGNLSFTGSNAVLSGTTIGSFGQIGGVLTITFNSNATLARLNQALSSLTYANSSDAPPASVQINWTFSDGNSGEQGSGGALTGTGSTTVNISAVNDAPTGSVTVSGKATQGQTLTVANTLADLDGLGTVSYQWLADGQLIGGATGSALTLAQAQVGKAISVLASYTDGGNTQESVTSDATAPVAYANANTAPSFLLTTGKAIIPVGASDDLGNAIWLEADGKILVAGYSWNGIDADFSLIRLNANGSLDNSFDGDGKAIIPVGASDDVGNAIWLEADGKILVAGYSWNSSDCDFSLIRLNADGSLDTSFDGDGKAIIPVGTSRDGGQAVALQADGKILVAGFSYNGSYSDFGLIRLNTNGSLDTSFDGDGKAIIPVGRWDDQGYAIALQADGKILVAGTSFNVNYDDFSLIRLNTDGSLDTSFDGDGKAIIPVGTSGGDGKAISLQSDGKILVAGTSYNGSNHDFSLIRLNADGSLDTSFDGDGKAIIPVGASNDGGFAMVLYADGKVLVAGYSYNSSDFNFSLIRLNADGSPDTSFDGDGKAIIPVANVGQGYAVTLQADGKILVAGRSKKSSDFDFSLIRLNADGSLDTSFGATPSSTTLGATVSYSENSPAIALDTSVAISDPELNTLNNAQGNYSGTSVSLARSTGANDQDVFGASGNLSFTGGNAVLAGTTIGSYTNSGGTLAIAFNSNATQARLNQALSSLTYANSSDAPPASVQINWTFSDGNSGEQGSGGALTGAGSTTVNISAVNDAPTGSVTVSGKAAQDQTLTAANTLADLDGLGTVSYQWLADGQLIGGATGSTLTLGQAQVGKAISVLASYTDGGNTLESVTSNASALVAVAIVNAAPSFEINTGKAIIPVGTGSSANAITLQSDGKILLAGSSSLDGKKSDFSLIRLNANGSLDNSFDGDGKATIPVGTGSTGNAITLQADGKILMAGSSSLDGKNEDFSLIRLNANGSLDTSFDGDGKVIIPVGTGYDVGQAMALQADGKILVAGYSYNGSSTDFSLIRLNANGSLDTSFDGDGKAIIPVGTGSSANTITLQADGKILMAGSSFNGKNTDFGLVRLNANGSLDTSFDGDGKAIIPVGTSHDVGNAMWLQADGKILVAGQSINGSGNDNFSLIRLNANGSLDSSFDGDGKAIIPVGGWNDYGLAITLQADGKALVAGYSYTGSNHDFSLVRLNANGSLDTSFDGDGKAIIPVGTSQDGGRAITLQTDGKILVAGWSNDGSDGDFSLIRLNADGSLDTSFGDTQGSNTLGGTVSYAENAPAIALDTSVAIYDLELAALNNGLGNYSGASVTLVRSTGENVQDVFGASGNLSFTGSNAVLSGTTIGSFSQSGGTLNITFNSNTTQARINEALSSLTYANSSDAPPASVQINWTFKDGNSGDQGSGGALTGQGSTRVNITAFNDAPNGSVTVSGMAIQGEVLTASNTLADADGLGTISYQWKVGGTEINGATASTYILTQAEVGKVITVTATYTDLQRTAESVTSSATSAVANAADITGHVYHWKSHVLMQGVQMADGAATATTDANGSYHFKASDLTLVLPEPTLATENVGTAIDASDALAALKIAAGRNPNADGSPVTPYQFIAADMNEDGVVTSADALAILKLYHNRQDAPAAQWLFVNESEDFWNEAINGFVTSRKSVVYDTSIDLNAQADAKINLVAVLKGDVNGSWAAPAGTPSLDTISPDYFAELSSRLGFPHSQWGVII